MKELLKEILEEYFSDILMKSIETILEEATQGRFCKGNSKGISEGIHAEFSWWFPGRVTEGSFGVNF